MFSRSDWVSGEKAQCFLDRIELQAKMGATWPSMSQLRPTWGQLGANLGPTWAPGTLKIVLPLQREHDFAKTRCWLPRAAQEAPRDAQEAPRAGQEGPGAAQERPREAQERPTRPQESPKSGQENPKSGQESPKSRPDGPKRAPRAAKRANIGPTWANLGQLQRNLGPTQANKRSKTLSEITRQKVCRDHCRPDAHSYF